MVFQLIVLLSLFTCVDALRLQQEPKKRFERSTTEFDVVASFNALDQDAMVSVLEGAAAWAAAHPENVTKFTPALLRAIRPCAKCLEPKRFGGDCLDDGYIMCEAALNDNSWPKLVGAYSYGLRGKDCWGQHVSSVLAVPVYQYDCFNTDIPQEGPLCKAAGTKCEQHFKAECLRGRNESTKNGIRRVNEMTGKSAGDDLVFKTMEEHFAQNHASLPRGALVMKIDIESNEWSAIAQEHTEILMKFRQIVGEFHFFDQLRNHEVMLNSLNQLFDAGFEVAHIHGTNIGYHFMVDFGEYKIPRTIEMTFVQRSGGKAKPEACIARDILIPEDRRNTPRKHDLPVATLPWDQ